MATNDALTAIFLSFRSQLARAISRLVPPHEIEDIVQETYVRVCRFNSKLAAEHTVTSNVSREIREPRALMVRVARNLALDHVKRAEARLTESLDERMAADPNDLAFGVDQTYLQASADEEFSRFCEAVRQLPQQCRRVFVLKKVYGYSQQEIAATLGLSESTVEKHIAKGIRLCAEHVNSRAATDATIAPMQRHAASPFGDRR